MLKPGFVLIALAALLAGPLVTSAHADEEGVYVPPTSDDGTAATGHTRQFGISAQLGTGYRVLFPYNEEYCGQQSDSGERKSVCTGRSPFFMDLGVSYGVSPVLELLAEVRLGLEKDFSQGGVNGPRPLSFAAGVRLYVDPDGALKFFSTLEGVVETTDYSRSTIGANGTGLDSGADFGVRNVNGVELDLHRTFGIYVHFGETMTFVNWLRFDLHAGVGLQARFP